MAHGERERHDAADQEQATSHGFRSAIKGQWPFVDVGWAIRMFRLMDGAELQ